MSSLPSTSSPSSDRPGRPRPSKPVLPKRALPNRLRAVREERGWSQAELAERADVSRARISAIEQRKLNPSVDSALRIARALQRPVEELFGIEPAEPQAACAWAFGPAPESPVRFWQAEVGGTLVSLPAETTAQGLLPHEGVLPAGTAAPARASNPALARSTLVLASCDPALGLLVAEYGRRCGFRVLALQRSSGEALELLRRGVIHAAGVHLARADDPDGNAPAVRERLGAGHALLHVAAWDSGVALSEPGRWTARSLARSRLRWIGREPGSGARACQDEVLLGRPAPRRLAASHQAVGEALRGGWAEAGICLRLVAQDAGLGFVPVRQERYDLCLRADALADPRLVALVETIRSRRYGSWLAELPGYRPAPRIGELELVG